MEKYDTTTKTLYLRVLDYEAKIAPSFTEQRLKRPLQRIHFLPLEEQQLKSQLSYYNSNRLAAILRSPEAEDQGAQPKFTPPTSPKPDFPHIDTHLHPTAEEMAEAKQVITFQIRIQELRFGMGIISGSKRVEEWGIVVDFAVENDFIVPEFDHVKPFFSKALGKRQVEVQLKASIREALDGQLSAHSPELKRIDERLLEIVRMHGSSQFLKKPKLDLPDKSLFTDEELYEQYEENPLGEQLHSSAEDILQHLLDNHQVRNAKQLQYLAGKLQSPKQKIRFTLTPLFGFLFSHKEKEYQHYIWELLNSHATYLWSADPAAHSPSQQLKQLERNLQFIRVHGRRAYRENQQQDPVFQFYAISHQYAKSLLVDSFPRWRNRLLERLL